MAASKTSMLDIGFHPAVAAWFDATFSEPTPAQLAAWPLIRAGRSTLVAAPTGSGKTLTAFLAAINELVREGLACQAAGDLLPDETQVLYVSPLKALSNDIRLNLAAPLAGIAATLASQGQEAPEIRTAVRTGDTPARERAAMNKRPPHILVTTPESLYVLLGSASGRLMLLNVRTVIVDEIHAVAGNKRGSHLTLTLARLDALCGREVLRIGLSATQRPIERVADFLVGKTPPPDLTQRACAVVDVGHARQRDLALELPPVPLSAVMSNEVWERVYDRLAELAVLHRTTLIFVNTRRMAERAARHLSERLGRDVVAAHHGSLAKEHRLDAEQRLKAGSLRVLIATASLELGIDIGDVDLVCQLGSPRSISAFLQRVGRSGHHVGGTPKGRLFPTSRDDLVECAALLDCITRGELDELTIPQAPLDVLAQHLVAEVACQEWNETALFDVVRTALPFAELSRERFSEVVQMLTEGYTSRHGARAAYLHRDVVTGTLRARRNARLTALSAGGTIPENADYAVWLEPQAISIGTVNEDFAVESLAGDVFQLGNASYRILKIESGRVKVENANGQPPNIPFWLGEAPGRSDALSVGVARLRANVDADLASSVDHATQQLALTADIGAVAAQQIVEYLAPSRAALGVLPSQQTLVMERFFDESGGMQLVIHSPYGSRVNRAWGLALRKRFCRTFNFELQAAATEDAIVLSLSTSHSFALDEVWRYIHSNSAEHLLIQALLDAPLFGVRWRWNATTALALPRLVGGRKVAPQLQRMKSDDLLATVFPDQVACLENIVGERELPHHPLVDQTIDDCLHEAMDADAWCAMLREMERGAIRLVARDLPAPSPLAAEILNARPYAFLDDAPLEERRTQAVLSRRWSDPTAADDLGALDNDAIAAVRDEAWPRVRDADEMYEALLGLSCLNDTEVLSRPAWLPWVKQLAASGRATRMEVARGEGLWIPLERLPWFRALFPRAATSPMIDAASTAAEAAAAEAAEEAALISVVRARMTGFGPFTVAGMARPLTLPASRVALALTRLENEGYAVRGRFTPGATMEEWCERRLLARIHRYTVKRLRREIEPVAPRDFMRFLFEWQHVANHTRTEGRDALPDIVAQLEGFELAAAGWEQEILPARVRDYEPAWLDDLCRSGRFVWMRLSNRLKNRRPATVVVKDVAAADSIPASLAPVSAPATPSGGATTPIVLLPRRNLAVWSGLLPSSDQLSGSARAQAAREVLLRHGAMFFDELLSALRVLPAELETALGELVALGELSADSFAGLRALIAPTARSNPWGGRGAGPRGRTRHARFTGGMDDAGRWALLRRPDALMNEANEAGEANKTDEIAPDALEHVAMTLLRRYGVVFWRLLEREADWLPPWRDLLRVYHRLEARGEIRGGRFVDGPGGEQFALPETIPLLRQMRHQPHDRQWQVISAIDPLNLVGTLLAGNKVPALTGNRIVFLDGVPVATLVAGKFHYLPECAPADHDKARLRLTGRRAADGSGPDAPQTTVEGVPPLRKTALLDKNKSNVARMASGERPAT